MKRYFACPNQNYFSKQCWKRINKFLKRSYQMFIKAFALLAKQVLIGVDANFFFDFIWFKTYLVLSKFYILCFKIRKGQCTNEIVLEPFLSAHFIHCSYKMCSLEYWILQYHHIKFWQCKISNPLNVFARTLQRPVTLPNKGLIFQGIFSKA